MTAQTSSPLPIAAILYTPQDNIEMILMEAAAALGERGVRLGGVIQHDIGISANDPCAMELEDLSSGARFSLSQELGRGSEACRLDPDALARASMIVRNGLDQGADLVIFNKFGAQEAAGAGLRTEMGLAALAGTPLLTAVGHRFLPEWNDFTGGEGSLLQPTVASVLAWWNSLRGDA
ncbi:DUF2478 domain-containing protein [Azoarcus olearius]|uniref:DUF2478 domain-containing protein n=1 Tax=Azoarcus sp. (strain BH72) TaxID=418699 RepID=A1K3C6_AZOSB|nr:DUF2478 domain-containing protein [Azoarcus olearius]ANQ83858.1 hypothetical protein dqs_0783 [Azoarcus olearius]CAL93331.1 conserved hypothetical protein [Azoarcus olearius]